MVLVIEDDRKQQAVVNENTIDLKISKGKPSTLLKKKKSNIIKDHKDRTDKNLADAILGKLSKFCKLELVNELEDSIKYNVKEFKRLSIVFDACEKLVASGQIEGFWVSEMNLEDIFLICSNDHAKEVKVLENESEGLK